MANRQTKQTLPPQHQTWQPGIETEMRPQPASGEFSYTGCGKLRDKERTFRTNIFSMFYLTQAALPYLTKGARIINSSSVTAYRGSPQLLDYSATKGAIVAFTRSLSLALIDKGIYVNAVAPGPIWTPLVASSFSEDKVASFGGHTPMGRPGQPEEVAPAYVFLACTDASYMSGQVLHPNGGEVVNA